MMKFIGLIALLALIGFSLSSCASVGTLNAVTRNDPGAKLVERNVAYGSEKRQTLDIYAPKKMTGPRPVMVFVYGGSWNSGAKKDYSFAGHAFAANGYVTVLIDYRLVPDVVFPAFVEDTAAGVAWVHKNIANYNGDPNQIFISGHSAGAYNAVMTGLDPKYLAAHGLSPNDIAGVVGLSGPYDFLPLDAESTRAAFGHVTDKATTQPINFVSGDVPPMLLLTGTDDTTVKPRNTRELAKRLNEGGYTVTTDYYEGLDHVDPLLALSVLFRGKGPVLEDILRFMSAVETSRETP